MIKLELGAADPGSLLLASASAGVSVASSVSEITIEWLGVPMPVVFAALAGAWVARSYAPAGNFFAALAATSGWTVIACVLAPLLHALAGHFGVNVPVNGMAAFALLAALAMPLALPIVREKIPEILAAWLDRLKGGGK